MRLNIEITILLAAASASWIACGPISAMPGTRLSGTVVTEPIADWTFVQHEGLCQLELPGPIPYSINLNCMSDGDALFVSCSNCEGKRWSSLALKKRKGRIRVGGTIYPVSIEVLRDPADLDRAWRARTEKLAGRGNTNDGRVKHRPDHWWSFRLASRN